MIDFGTATTFNCVNRRGEFIGGAIAPGIVTSVEALINRAARLARVELVRPKEAIGRNTTTNLQSGAIYGYAGLVEGLVDRMRAEMGGSGAGDRDRRQCRAPGGCRAQPRAHSTSTSARRPAHALRGGAAGVDPQR